MDRWKTIPDYGDHYQISQEGLVRVNPRSPRLRDETYWKSPNRLKGGDLVKQSLGGDGYWRTNLRKSGQKYTSCHIHRLLMLTFRPTNDRNLQVNHKDGNKQNNNLNNLEWVTKLENLTHAWENGLRPKPHHVSLTKDQVNQIRKRYRKGQRPFMRELGVEFGVTTSAIHRIVNFKNWKTV